MEPTATMATRQLVNVTVHTAPPIDTSTNFWDPAGPGFIFNILLFVVLFLAALTVCCCYRYNARLLEREDVRLRLAREQEHRGSRFQRMMRGMGSVLPTTARSSTVIKAKAALYELAFEENGNQVQLTENHIVQKEAVDSDVEAGQNENDEDKSKYLVLDRSQQSVGTIDFSHKSTKTLRQKKRRSSIVHPVNKALVRGPCAVCLEDFHAGDWVVWSETKSCPHVYHKACIVQYFSRQSDEENNPCPTCRQSFCTVVAKEEDSKEETAVTDSIEIAAGNDDSRGTEGEEEERHDDEAVNSRRESV